MSITLLDSAAYYFAKRDGIQVLASHMIFDFIFLGIVIKEY